MMFELNGITMEYVDLRPDELGVEYTGQRVIINGNMKWEISFFKKV